MLEKIIKSGKALLVAGALTLSGCFNSYNYTAKPAKFYSTDPTPAAKSDSFKPNVIQRASFYPFYDQSKEISPENLTWNFEYRLIF